MYKKVIKKYRYVGDGAVIVEHPERILKQMAGGSIDYDQFDPEARRPEKKKKEFHTKLSQLDGRSGADASCIQSAIDHSPEKRHIVDNAPEANKPVPERDVRAELEKKLKAQLESRFGIEKQATYRRGYDEGRKAGKAENEAELKRLKQIVDNIKSGFDKSRSDFFTQIEKVAIDMSTHLARKIIGEAIYAIPEIVKTNVDKCIGLLAGSGTVQIKINPNDYEIIKSNLPDLERRFDNKFSFVLEPDNHVERGGCLIEFEGSVIDGRIDTQLDKLQKQMELLN